MADTTALNTENFSGVNQLLTEYFNEGIDIHTLECLFHINEIYLTHVISMTEGKRKGPGSLESGALLNNIPSIEKPRIENLVPREQCDPRYTHCCSPSQSQIGVVFTAKAKRYSGQ